MSDRKRVFRLFWAWNDEKEELWLEQMAKSGWHLVGGPFVYTFEKGVPADVRYRLDYQSSRKGLDEYLRLCSDAGWERVFEFAGWQYFRTASPEAPEIYTDAASRIAKYQRLLVICVTLAMISVATNLQTLMGGPSGSHARAVFLWARWGVAGLLVLWACILTRLIVHIRRLKQKAAASGTL